MRLTKQPSSLPFRVDPAGRGVRARKDALRRELMLRRKTIPADLRDTTEWKVVNHLRSLLGPQPGVVALFYPKGSELDLRMLAVDLWKQGQTVCLPRVVAEGHPLGFSIWEPHGATELDAAGIPTGTGDPVWPTTMIVPMLGYTREGHRLGYGGGYYDRTLKGARLPTLAIGVCFTELEVEDFPAEYHDQRLDMVVTGKEVIRGW